MKVSKSTQSEAGEDFQPQEMVSWFRPRELLETGIRALFAEKISHFVDRRESQAGLPPVRIPDDCSTACQCDNDDLDGSFCKRDDLWIDHVADLGDGWDSTYTMAMLLGRENLKVRGLRKKGSEHEAPLEVLPRAEFAWLRKI